MTHALRTIVVGVGQLDETDPHLDMALHLASEHGAKLYAVRAFRLPDPLVAAYPEVATYEPEVTHAAEQAVLRRLKDQVAQAGGADVECHTSPGPADAAILDVAGEVGADLIVVGATERGAISRAVLGTTAGRVIRAASVPVLVNRRPEVKRIGRVLLTTDLSELSGRVHRHAAELASALGGTGAELRTLLVVGDDVASPPDARAGVLERITRDELDPFLDSWSRDDETIEGKVRVGDTATEILAEVEEWEADLLVVGTHGRGGLSRLLIGSVAESVVSRAPCDVLVIPAASFRNESDENPSRRS